nr:MAG TPA: hypothetical protein [Caudoviricetes sp.]
MAVVLSPTYSMIINTVSKLSDGIEPYRKSNNKRA